MIFIKQFGRIDEDKERVFREKIRQFLNELFTAEDYAPLNEDLKSKYESILNPTEQ